MPKKRKKRGVIWGILRGSFGTSWFLVLAEFIVDILQTSWLVISE